MFFGRAHELREIAGYVNGDQSISLVGPRRIGKTSLLIHLMRPPTRAAMNIGPENLLVFQTCATLAGLSENEIFAQWCVEIAAALRDLRADPEPALKTAAADPSRISFVSAIRRLDQRGMRVVLLLDEFEDLARNPKLDVPFFNGLRAAGQSYRIVFLTVSARSVFELTYLEQSQDMRSSPFFNTLAGLPIGLLAEDEARALIRDPMLAAGRMLSTGLEDFIYSLAGGHPLALQVACYHAWENPDDKAAIERKTLQEMNPHFQYAWQNLGPAERDMLDLLSDGGSPAVGDPASNALLDDLRSKCLVIRMGNAFSLQSAAWAEFVAAQAYEKSTLPAEVGLIAGSETGGGSAALQEHSNIPWQPHVDPTSELVKPKHTIGELLWNSIPEMIGGLAVLVIGALLFQRDEVQHLVNSWASSAGQIHPKFVLGGIALIGIGILAVVLRRRRR
jgi:hypothetical protein